MSQSSFVFTPMALRSLQQDEDMLQRYECRRQLASQHQSTSYMLRKEARDRTPQRSGATLPAAVCQDVVVQNALYTGNLEALQELFPRGSRVRFIIEPQGGDMRWVATGEGETTQNRNPVCSAMAYAAPKVRWRKPKKYRNDVIATAKATGCVQRFWNSLLVGDELTIVSIVDDEEYDYLINAIYDTSDIDEWKSFRFNYTCLRLWSLSYEQELTTPLHITASRGFNECLRLLLQRGADVELAPGGITALHESCENCQPECTKLLLSHGANANAVSEDGYMPLHYCTHPESLECAKYLLQYGAAVSGCSSDEGDTPLHVAARNGLPDHTELYLRYGASVDKLNTEGLTPLNASCSQHQEVGDLQRYFKVCQTLLRAGAAVHMVDQDRRSPLHMSCKNANPDIVDLLLANGACVNDMDYGGEAPMHNILKVVCYKVPHQPERIVRALLNHGSIRVWPGALPMVLKHCSMSPRTIEVLLNAYSHFKVTDTWIESVPPEVQKEHKEFYDSIFSLAMTPRSLQHLARCKLRDLLQGRVHKVVPKLALPTFIKSYLLLEYRGYIH